MSCALSRYADCVLTARLSVMQSCSSRCSSRRTRCSASSRSARGAALKWSKRCACAVTFDAPLAIKRSALCHLCMQFERATRFLQSQLSDHNGGVGKYEVRVTQSVHGKHKSALVINRQHAVPRIGTLSV